MTDLESYRIAYAKNLSAKLKNPNYFSMDQRKKGREFLDAWAEWASESKKLLKVLKLPVLLCALTFPFFIAYVFYAQRKCDKIFKELEEKQNAFHDSLRGAKDG